MNYTDDRPLTETERAEIIAECEALRTKRLAKIEWKSKHQAEIDLFNKFCKK